MVSAFSRSEQAVLPKFKIVYNQSEEVKLKYCNH